MTRPSHPPPILLALDASVMSLTRELGGYFEHAKPMDEPKQINGPIRPTRGRWPPEVWAEMERIYRGEEP